MTKQEKWYRDCPSCGDEIEYTVKGSWYNAKSRKARCSSCYRTAAGQALKERHAKGELSMPIKKPNSEYNKTFFRKCSDCNKDIGYTTEKQMKRAELHQTVCNSCSAKKYKKGISFTGASEDQIKKMRATKAGFSSWEEYKKKYPKKQFYKREVWRHTNSHDLDSLENADKRGRCGVKGAYQLDHIISINEGWEKGIPAEEIGAFENLRIIPWKQNLTKGA